MSSSRDSLSRARARASFGAQLELAGKPADGEGLTRSLFVRVHFEVRANTVFGEHVYIVGNLPQLGCWEPRRGIRMETSEGEYPTWRVDPLLLSNEAPSGEVEFKFVTVDAKGDVNWEPLPANRKLSLADCEEAQVIADWGSGLPGGPRDVPYGQAPRSVARSSTCSTPRSSEPGTPRIPGSPTPTRAAAAAAPDLPPAVPRGLVERLIVVQYVLPLRVNKAADGGWVVTWDDTSLLATSVQGGRHLMGSLNLQVLRAPPSPTTVHTSSHHRTPLASPHPFPPPHAGGVHRPAEAAGAAGAAG